MHRDFEVDIILPVARVTGSFAYMAFTVAKAFDLISVAHERGRLAHAFLVTGAKGGGKEDLAAKMAHLLNGKQDEGDDLWGEPVEVEAPLLAEQEGEYIRVVRPRSKSRKDCGG